MEQMTDAAIPESLRKRGKEVFKREDEVHHWRSKLEFPDTRRAAVEYLFKKPFAEIRGPEKEIAQAVAIAHDRRAIADMSENYFVLLLTDEALGTVPLLKEINARLRDELDKEIEAVSAWLQAAWSVLPCATTIEDAEPLQWLRHRRWQANEAAQNGKGGANGLRSALKGLV